MPRGGLASFAPSGDQIAYNPISSGWDSWKRYRGGRISRIGIYELMTLDEPLQESMRTGGASTSAIRAMAREGGMITLMEDGVQKVLKGVTSMEELRHVLG